MRKFILLMISSLVAAQSSGQSLVQSNNQPLRETTEWGERAYRGNPWVENTSLPYRPTKGLYGRHMSVAQSHGRYYNVADHEWLWQRPTLYCTTEDLFTQTFLVPFLYPMLERAGAIVWTPRERCWMKEEVIVDNDERHASTSEEPSGSLRRLTGLYLEQNGKYEWQSAGPGFAWHRDVYLDGQNPHQEGTSRIVEAQASKRNATTALWMPTLPRDGEYAVYVSYPSLPTHVPDALYTVRHRGQTVTIKVNQQMGGGTWVYLGTFDFAAGQSKENSVTLSNQSNYRGTVGADAVRFGGGMGNIARCDSLSTNPTVSRLPRYLEGARYCQQWNGMPRSVYSYYNGANDYNDDILTRPLATNHLARGSSYLPGDSGLCVPIELEVAVHSDAGTTTDNNVVGSLGIFTSDFEDGLLPSGLSRKTSGVLSSLMLDEVKRSITHHYDKWICRDNWDRNYGESRVPRLPGVIFEMLSHQNLNDLRLGHDPLFKFHLSRALYKAILRYSARMHNNTDVVVQPLPVRKCAAITNRINRTIRLSWEPTDDPLEATALPSSYVVYQRTDNGGWDNGTVTNVPSLTIQAEADVLYRFRIEAVNEGGASLPSEELCACLSSQTEASSLLLVNGFTRLAAPISFANDSTRGFLMDVDPGVVLKHTPAYCGRQRYFSLDGILREKENGLGYSTQEWVGKLLAGNTFDYPSLHASDMLSAGMPLHISSCSRQVLEEGGLNLMQFRLLDLIFGAQRRDGYSRTDFKTFTPSLRSAIADFARHGGALLVSGAYLASDLQEEEDISFARNTLHWHASEDVKSDSILTIYGMNTQCSYITVPNEEHLSTPRLSSFRPTESAFSTMNYEGTNQAAAIAYQGPDHRAVTLGFPIEQIVEPDVRRALMAAFIRFLLSE
ncbi:MAG: hypothetical protein KBT12_02600 [Bacteroidales bacterium]|nr:hypothetical protein [Candidatus Physcousia equi]